MTVKELITELLNYELEDEVKISVHTACDRDKEDPDIYHCKINKDDFDNSINYQELIIFADCNDGFKKTY